MTLSDLSAFLGRRRGVKQRHCPNCDVQWTSTTPNCWICKQNPENLPSIAKGKQSESS